jgi:hypothetical protein
LALTDCFMSLDKGEGNRLIPLIQHFSSILFIIKITLQKKFMTITEKKLQKTGTQTNMPEQKNAKDEDVRRIVEQIRKDYANTLIELAK